ncbi:MAG: hypothetical protein M1839_000701 [Geoglossum umbratile]|nr:MAG: hypothetical protein M1839_000701 [Geoglossum umbratile]
MVVLGFLSDSIEAVDSTIKFIIQLKHVQDQVHGLRKDLEDSRSQLKRLKELLRNSHHSTDGWVEPIIALQAELHETLSDSINLLKRFHPSVTSNSGFFPNLRQNLRWMVDSRYQGTVKGLQERILKIERRIDRELLFRISQLSQPPAPIAQGSADTSQPSGESKNTKSHPSQQIVSESPPAPPSRSQTASTDTTICVPHTNNIYSAQPIKRASTLQYTPAPFTQEILPTTGAVKVWFESGIPNRLQSHRIQRVAILRDGAGCFRGIMMTRLDGRILKEEISQFWSDVAKHPLPVHGRYTRDARDSDGLARNCIRFLHDKISPSVPKYYSFSSDEDYRGFQSKIVGKWLLFWAEVQSISSAWSNTMPLSEYQIVQLWQSNGVQSIQFFRNGKDGIYSKHSMSSLQVDKSSPKTLKLNFMGSEGTPPPGTVPAQEQIMKHLSIVFTNPKDRARFLDKADFRRREAIGI